MTLEVEALIERRRLRRKVSLWRVLAIGAVALALAVASFTGGRVGGFGRGTHIARIDVSGLIVDDRAQLELLKKVGKMLRYADATAGRLKIAREMCSLVEIIDQATEETRNSAQMRHVTIDASKVEEVKLFADHHQTACALQYIVENAIHASKPGATIVLEGARSAAGAYEMRIIDRGAGMSEKQLANAFLPFAQAEAGLARYREGLGLGLPIANLLLQAQQARLAIKSKLGEGTEVEIAFEAAALMRRDTAEAA